MEQSQPVKPRRSKRRVSSPGRVEVGAPSLGLVDNSRGASSGRPDSWERDLVAQMFEAAEGGNDEACRVVSDTELADLGAVLVPRSAPRQNTDFACQALGRQPSYEGLPLSYGAAGRQLPEAVGRAAALAAVEHLWVDDAGGQLAASAPLLDQAVESLPLGGLSLENPGCKVGDDVSAIYINEELERNVEFAERFEQSEVADKSNSTFYQLFLRYERCCEQVLVTEQELADLMKQADELRSQVWYLEKSVVRETGECQDGNPVAASETSELARFNSSSHSDLETTLARFRDDLWLRRVQESLTEQKTREEIVAVLQEAASGVREACGPHIVFSPPVLLKRERQLPAVGELVHLISVMFHFLRRRECRNARYLDDLREWLTDSVALLMRCATWQDHLYVLHHVLRCPPGIAPWVAAMVHVPWSRPMSRACLDHAVAALNVILMPVQRREAFMPQMIECESWVILDVDGDGENNIDLTEEDLIKLLSQIPIRSIFQVMVNVIVEDTGRCWVNIPAWDHPNVRRAFAFAAYLVELFRRGLETYGGERYKQFSKRLACLISSTVSHIADLWEILQSNQCYRPGGPILPELCHTFSSLVEHAASAIYSSQGLGIWQVLAQLPFHLVTRRTLWRLYFVLHQPYSAETAAVIPITEDWEREVYMWQGLLFGVLDDLVASVPQDEAYYLLSMLALLGSEAVKMGDMALGKAALQDLFQVGFVSAANKDNCSKACRTLISDMTSACPALLSDVFRLVRRHIALLEDTWRYLFSDLPLGLWVPPCEDVNLLTGWLVDRHLLTPENACARHVLARLDYASEAMSRGIHQAIALRVVEAVIKFCPEPVPFGQAAGYMPPKVANYVRNPKNEAVFTKWAWDLLFRLRLHLMDRDPHTRLRMIYSPANDIQHLPDIHAEPSLLPLSQGVMGIQSIACFATLLSSVWGHCQHLIASKGMELLDILVKRRKFIPALIVIQHIVPVFLENPQALIYCRQFTGVLFQVIHGDKGKSGLAANLLGSGDFPGPILECLAGVMRLHLKSYQLYGLGDDTRLAELWVNLLVQVPNWVYDSDLIFLLDVLTMHTFAKGRTLMVLNICLRHQYLLMPEEKSTSETMDNRAAGGALNSIINWISSRPCAPSLYQKPATDYNTWYAALALSVEEEVQAPVWVALGMVIDRQHYVTRASIDKAIKECGAPLLTTNELAIHRWANLALEVAFDHPLLIYIWDRFFSLLLERVQMPGVDLLRRRCVGRMYFNNSSMLIQLQSRLRAARDHFDLLVQEQQPLPVSELTDLEWARSARSTFTTFVFWISEPRLYQAPLKLSDLPSVFNAPRLMDLLRGMKTCPWQYLEGGRRLMCIHQHGIDVWMKACQRSADCERKQPQPPELPAASCSSLIERFKFYDSPLPTPVVNPALLEMKPVAGLIAGFKRASSALHGARPDDANNRTDYLIQTNQLQRLISTAMDVLSKEAVLHIERSRRFRLLDAALLVELTTLYENVSRERIKVATCSSSPPSPGGLFSRPPHVTCAGGATLSLAVTEAVRNNTTQRSLETNRMDYDLLLKSSWEPAPKALPLAVREVEQILEYAVCAHLGSPSSAHQKLGVELFYQLYSQYTNDLTVYVPTRVIIKARLMQMGGVFLAGDGFQCRRLMIALLAEDRLVEELSVYLTPHTAPCYVFVDMYRLLATSLTVARATPERLVSFAMILGKFNLQGWLDNSPILAQRTAIIECVFVALRQMGQNPTIELKQIEKMYGNHMTHMLRHCFPEHFGEILKNLLDASRDSEASVRTWYLFLNTVLGGDWKISDQVSIQDLSMGLRTFATNQTHLSFQLVICSAKNVGDFYLYERRKVALQTGLFGRYHVYVRPLTALMGLLGHCVIVSSVQHHRGTLSGDLCLDLYTMVEHLYSAWISPLVEEGDVPPRVVSLVPARFVADLSVYRPPWTAEDGPVAAQAVHMFAENLRIILDTLPGCGRILSSVWSAYVTQFVRPTAMTHALGVMQENFRLLPWHKMSPNIADMELMLEVSSKYNPPTHVFLGAIFLEVQWGPWVQDVVATWELLYVNRAVCIFLKLVVKLCCEPTVRHKAKSNAVVGNAFRFPWDFVDAQVFQEVLDWWVFSSDARVVLDLGEPYTNPLDAQVFKLLRIAAPFDQSVKSFHPTTPAKRQHFLKCCYKMMGQAGSKHRQQFPAQRKSYIAFVARTLDWVEIATAPRGGEALDAASVESAALLVNEAMLVATSSPAPLVAVVVDGCLEWLERHDNRHAAVHGMVKLVPQLPVPAAVGVLLEAALTSYFTPPADVTSAISWRQAVALASPLPAFAEQQTFFLEKGYIMVLHTLLLQDLEALGAGGNEDQAAALLARTMDLINKVKPTEAMEHKLPLLWGVALHLIQRLLTTRRRPSESSLMTLIQLLQQLADDKASTSWGLLQALKMKKYYQVSDKFRMLCRSMAAYLLAQLPDGGGSVRAIRVLPFAEGSMVPGTRTIATPESPHALRPSTATRKAVAVLEQLAANKAYAAMSEGITAAVAVVNDGSQSLHSACLALNVMANALLKKSSAPVIADYCCEV